MKKTIIFLLVLTSVFMMADNTPEKLVAPADVVILNAKIWTSNPNQPVAEALAINGSVISYVGSGKAAKALIGEETRVIDAKGRRITPGFVDNHCHVLWIGGLQALMPAILYECSSMEDLREALVERNSAEPDLPFVGAIGWKMEYVPYRNPRKELLDEIISDRPVILMSYSGQAGWLNSKAVEICAKNLKAFEALHPVKDEDTGEFTGELRHFHAFNFLDFFTWEDLGEDGKQKFAWHMTKAIDHALSVGVTAFHDVQIYPEFIPFILDFKEKGGLDNVHVRLAYYVGRERFEDVDGLIADLTKWKALSAEHSDLSMNIGNSVKFYIDGTPDNLTSFMLEPFSCDEGGYGEYVWTQEEFDSVVAIIDRLELQACTHSNGDAGIRRVVNSYERAASINGKRDSRHRVEHCELPTPKDKRRMAELGIHAAMQPTHFYGDEMLERAFGRERLNSFMPWKSLADEGVTVSFGSDWCAGPINPFYGLLISGKRVNYKGKSDWGKAEKISLEEGVTFWTINSAKALFMEDRIGSIEVGKQADIVLFNKDPFKVTSLWFLLTNDIDLGKLDNFVDMTMVNGQIVYQRVKAKL